MTRASHGEGQQGCVMDVETCERTKEKVHETRDLVMGT